MSQSQSIKIHRNLAKL